MNKYDLENIFIYFLIQYFYAKKKKNEENSYDYYAHIEILERKNFLSKSIHYIRLICSMFINCEILFHYLKVQN